jgi:hypothetical protein
MTVSRLLLSGLAALALVACGPSDDPFTADMKMICKAGQDENLPPEMRQLAGMKEIAGKIKTAEAARLMSELMQAAPADRDQLLEPALAKAKLKRCPFLGRP